MSETLDQYQQLDVIWLAVDAKGHLAAFITAGEGPIPATALPLVDGAEEEALSSPVVTGHRLLVTYARPDDLIALARRGLFVYDWSDVHRTRAQALGGYELVATPEEPLLLLRSSSGIQERASAVRLAHATFGADRLVRV
jgi:hypothetical protein